MNERISLEELKVRLRYEPETGRFFRLVKLNRSVSKYGIGTATGYVTTTGRRVVSLAPHGLFREHRLAFLYMTGRWPGEVDHINGDQSDNRWCNLREVTHRQNQQNKLRPYANNKVGLLGVYKKRKRFAARIVVDGKGINLGVFDCPHEAHATYMEAKKRLHILQPGLDI